ncbi:hypothetical protein PG993_006118 [Apiospora rasikravindrae]|uniref:SWIM-type domain-containing protein n=1 Tax=Apiospora rasikravindrae TaxID=990691 RepID=A0ABR1TAR8_9PEZI
MCKQTYLTFSSCACQLHYRHDPCAHGPASPSCRGRRTVLVPARNPLCYQHAFIQHQQARARARDEAHQQRQQQQQQQEQGDSVAVGRVGGTTLSLFTVGGEAWQREMQARLASAGRREGWWDV